MLIDRRQNIIDAATHSFSIFGYKATTMDQVAKLANVGKGTIYNFFESKEELLDEIIKSLIIEIKEEAEKAFNPELSFINNLHNSLYRILEFRLKHQLTIKLIQEEKEMGTKAVLESMEKLEQEVVQYITQKIRMAINDGKVNECDPELTAFIILKLYISLIFDWEKHHNPLQKEEILRVFEMNIFHGLSN
ncbi:TetR/AcrR family transcriptional regulator [Paenibacillus sp. BSR1-1]|uniref:TetR/AcrR family transcriptional regulator n=1 Tax=Paenibacillus sp. BSR1-1 TaxID=3020845 RepID=UPI0025B1D8E9|nr:TetR/AcrR family transcriptional regulator [Paenibacillus sp. BSR1-1]MDN3014618.1 TetR/AcrR family transcriptional regulator [Paenibacillus sp. BSR1-1]